MGVLAGLAIGVVGAGVGTYAASQAGKGSGQTRSVAGEAGGVNSSMGNYLANLKGYGDYQQQLNADTLQQAITGAPEIAGVEQMLTSAQRGQDLQDLRTYGGQFTKALGRLSPAYSAINAQVRDGGATSPLLDLLNRAAIAQGANNSPLYDQLAQQASSQLALGGALSPDEQRLVDQGTQSAFASRGLLMSNPAIFQQALDRTQYSQQRLNQRQQFAQGVDQLGLQEAQQRQQFQFGTQAANQAALANRQGFLLSANSATVNPLMNAIYGNRSVTTPGTVAGIFGAAPQVSSLSGAAQPALGYASDVYNTDFNAAESRAQNRAAAYAGIGSGLTSAAGSVGGAYAGSRGYNYTGG